MFPFFVFGFFLLFFLAKYSKTSSQQSGQSGVVLPETTEQAEKRKTITKAVLGFAFVLPVFAMLNCPGNIGDYAPGVGYCYLNLPLFSAYASFYYSMLYLSLYTFLMPVFLYIGFVFFFLRAITKR